MIISVVKGSVMKFLNKFIHEFIRNSIRNPKFRWIFIGASLIYLISPLDISPDVFPVLGWLDDGVLITLLATEVSQLLIERRQNRKQESTDASVESSVS